MHHIPRLIGAARVLGYARLPASCQTSRDSANKTIVGLAICQYENEPGFYLFGCDAGWQALLDTWHETMNDAHDLAEADYGIVADVWEAHDTIWVYCQDCKRCYRIGEERLLEGHLWCAYSDCEYGDIHDAIDWSIVRRNFPELPAEPERDRRYSPQNR